jgi:branched-chain amino acid transport system ATP-binding protein
MSTKIAPSTLRAGYLEIKNLVMVRGTKAVTHAIEMSIAPGKVTSLMGANGAGKTSTVLGISGVIEPAFGEIWLDGMDLVGMDADEIRRRGVATVPEGHQVLRELSVRDNLLVAGGGMARGELNASIERTIALFPELKEKLQQAAGDLSGGQQQMVAIAQALIVTPRFLVIDELSFGLAPTIVARLVPVIRRIADSGIGVLLIEQFTQLALALAHHCYVMSRGSVSYDGIPAKLREDPDILHRAYFPVSDKEAVGLT